MNRMQKLKFGIVSTCIMSTLSINAQVTYPIVDTRQSDFYNNTSVITTPGAGDAFYGQDAAYVENQPSYTDNGNGTITDHVTGLMWQQNMGDKITYAEAFAKADTMTLGGYSDWRVPTIKELYSLILFTGKVNGEVPIEMFIDSAYFNQPLGDTTLGERLIDAQTWSATQYKGTTMHGDSTVFGVNFLDGRIKGYPKYVPGSNNTNPRKMYFRMVRDNADYGINNFVDNGDGTITDNATGLMWQQADDGQSRDWENALSYAESLTLAGHSDWRLPNAKELQSLVDYTRCPDVTSSPAINPLFSITEINDPDGNPNQYPYFWTSTSHLDGTNPYTAAVYIAFGEAQGKMSNTLLDVHGAGAQRSDPKTGDPINYPSYFGPQGDVRYVFNNVRCVRDVLSSTSTQVNFIAPEMVGRITDSSATINMEADHNLDYYFEYGTTSGVYGSRFPETGYSSANANNPFEETINGLMPDTKYYYRAVYSTDGGNNWTGRPEYSFHTQRPVGNGFVFTITSDSHLSSGSGKPMLNLYAKTLANVLNDQPDLHFDMGDTFGMSDVKKGEPDKADSAYLFQRGLMGAISPSIPVYLAIGNHEDEEGWNLDDTSVVAVTKPVMSVNGRKKYFLNPVPDSFFSGNSDAGQQEISGDHLKEDYYAFQWGDALFVVLDPYWYTTTKPYPGTSGGEENDEVTGNRWDWTLGEEQYLWLKQTLESSQSKWKFVFSHQVTGGTNLYGRGGALAARDFEWGANEADFSAHRPGWTYSTSIHQLMVNNKITIFFHGHDHMYAKEDIDSMVYQECPQPTDFTYGNDFGEYTGNDSTIVQNNSGHLRVNVSPTNVTVDYVRAYFPNDGENGSVAYSYTIGTGTLVDTTPPEAPILADLTGECSVTATAPTTTDAVAGTITGTTSDPLEYTEQGTYTITWTFDDGNGNSIEVDQNVVVEDVINPTLSCAGNQVANADATSYYTVQGTEFDPTTTGDNCGVAGVENDFNNSSTLGGANVPLGTTTIVWTITDVAGNTNSCSFDILVNGYVGIESVELNNISIYPNPTNGKVQVCLDSNIVQSLMISDISGKTILEKSPLGQNEEIDLSNYNRGVFLFYFYTNRNVIIKKLIKE